VSLDEDDPNGRRFVGVGADRAGFDRFAAAYRTAFGGDPDLRAELLTPAQCPVAALMKLDRASAALAPRLTLDSLEVGSGRPLSGAITGLERRRLTLLAVGDEGRAVKLRVQIADDGKSASFSIGLSGDADSFGKPQVLLAIVSDRPLAALDQFRAGPSADILAKIGAQWREAGVTASLALFKLVE